MPDSADIRLTRIPLKNAAGQIPALGFGTLIPDPALTISATRDALIAGFRHFDCAERYGNEREVGQALREALATTGLSRERHLRHHKSLEHQPPPRPRRTRLRSQPPKPRPH